jgi:hypothetical protein
MASGLPTLVIGVGGTGLRVLQRVKERLLETYYGEVPSQITLLEFDTALQSPADNFCGVQLAQEGRMNSVGSSFIKEMELIQTNPSFTMDDAMREARQRNQRWDWMEVEKLDRLLDPQHRSILDGAGAFRPVGRTAFYLNYNDVETKLRDAMRQVVQKPVGDDTADVLSGLAEADTARSKRNVFLVGSLAGGTGSGGFLDLAILLRSIKAVDPSFSAISLIGIVALPRFFSKIADDLGRRVPNTYAGLRELDRFMRAHKQGTPYKFTGGHGQKVVTENTLFDLCYLVDVDDYNGRPAGSNPEYGALPAISDMIVAHTDLRLGLRLNAANINVASNYALPRDIQSQAKNYQYQSRRYYSALNCHTIIFPREDVAKSLSLRFLIDLIDNQLVGRDQRGQLLVPNDPVRVDDLVTFLSKDNPSAQERMLSELDAPEGNLDLGIFVRTMLQNQNRRFDTEPESVMRWLIEDGQQRKIALELIKRSIDETTRAPADPNNMGAYIAKVRAWQEKYVGPLVDPNNPVGDRKGGEWEQALGNLITDQRVQMEAYVQTMVLRMLNQRREETIGEQKTSLLRANRLGYTLAVLRALKEDVRTFIKQAELSFGETSRNLVQLRSDLEEHRAKVANFKGPIVPLFNPNPGPEYLRKLREVALAERQRLLRNLTANMAQQFGGDIAEEGRAQSVLDTAIEELDGWMRSLDRVRELIAQERGRHEARRKEKYAIGVRSYITDTTRFPRASEVEEGLYQRYRPVVWRTLLGPDPMGASGAGFAWETRRGSNAYFDYQITTKEKRFRLNPHGEPMQAGMLGEASGADAIAREWQAGGLRLMAEQVRGDKRARIAAYIPQLYRDQVDLKNRELDPHSRALVQLNGIQPSPIQEEHYLAVDPTSDDATVSGFFNWFNQNWSKTNNVFVQSESDVASTLLSLYHGIELDQFKGFVDSEPSYRAMERVEGCLHLFPEERLAADYEARIPLLKRNDWAAVQRIQPDVVIGLHDPMRVRSFALALVSGLIEDKAGDYSRELFLTLPNSDALRLTNARMIDNYSRMGTNDQSAARMLQAFQTYMLLGHAIDDMNAFNPINYDAVNETFRAWFNDHHNGKQGAEIDKLLTQWETSKDEPSLAPLFNAESKDPRFRDLGVVLMLELMGWRKLSR